MRKSAIVFVAALVFLLAAPGAVFAQRGGAADGAIQIRVASPVPRSSDWGRTMDRIAAEWTRVTNGAVRPHVIHDGLEGGETQMLSSLSTNRIQAALLTSHGLSEIVPEIMNLSVPFKIRNDAELDLVLREMLPFLEQRVNTTDFVVLTWSRAGWVYIFSREPVLVPNDLRAMPMAVSAESENMNAVFSRMGFNLVMTQITDMGPALATGRIRALYQSPAAIAPLGLHRTVAHMLDMPIAPFMGGIVLNRATWNRLGPANQRAMLEVTRRIAAEFDAAMPRTVANAMTTMRRGGLAVHTPTPQQQALWHNEVRQAMPPLLGSTFDRTMYTRITAILENSRRGQ